MAETLRLLRLANRRARDLLDLVRFFEIEYATVNLHDTVLGSYAVALLALSQQPEAPWDDDQRRAVDDTLDAFQEYIDEKSEGIRFTGQVARNDADRRLIITPSAMKCVVESLRKLSGNSAIQLRCEGLIHALHDICHNEPAFQEALEVLEGEQCVPRVVQPARRPPLAGLLFGTGSSRGSLNGGTSHPPKEEVELTERLSDAQ